MQFHISTLFLIDGCSWELFTNDPLFGRVIGSELRDVEVSKMLASHNKNIGEINDILA